MNWQRVFDESSGKPYYYDTETEETQWEFPLAVLERALSDIDWARVVSDQNEVYYYSEKTALTSWDFPKEGLDAVKAYIGDEVTLFEITGIEPVTNAEEKPEELEVSSKNVKITVNDILKLDQLLKSDKGSDDWFVSLSPEERNTIFFELLKESNVDKKWSFSKVIKELTSDKRYWCVTDPILRQQLFEKYLQKKADDDFKQNSLKSQEYKESFFKLLETKDVKYYSLWSTVSQLLTDNEVYESIPETFRVEVFNEFTNDLRISHELELTQLQTDQTANLVEYLKNKVEITTKFDQILPELKMEFPNLSKKDFLLQFDTAITSKEEEIEKVYEEQKKLNYTHDRKARDAFKSVLLTIRRSSQLKWLDFINSVKSMPEFIELCGHNGSTPIEYFWDIIDEENIKLRSKRDSIKNDLSKRNMAIDELTLEQFSSLSKNVCDIQDDEIELLYNQLKSNTKVKRPQSDYNQSSSIPNKRFKQY